MTPFSEGLNALRPQALLQRQRDRFEAEQRYLVSLDWTPDQLAAFQSRVIGIHERLDRLERRGAR